MTLHTVHDPQPVSEDRLRSFHSPEYLERFLLSCGSCSQSFVISISLKSSSNVIALLELPSALAWITPDSWIESNVLAPMKKGLPFVAR